MAIIDVVKCEMNDSELCEKFYSEDLRLGSQLVVYPSQVAIFVKGGQIFDIFEAGTYTLKTNNIPLLNKIINLPFGGDSPFQAEVWFLNLTAKLDIKWGTMTPIQLEDPKYVTTQQSTIIHQQQTTRDPKKEHWQESPQAYEGGM